MKEFITLVVSNFTLSLFILGVIAALVALLRKQNRSSKFNVLNTFLAYYILFNIGFAYLINFVMHVFYGQFIAHFIGWSQSPFQLEVGFASLGFAVVGFIAFFSNISFRAASIIGPSLFLWGAAGGHIYQMLTTHNFAPGNAGSIFWVDVFLPVVGLILLWMSSSFKNKQNHW